MTSSLSPGAASAYCLEVEGREGGVSGLVTAKGPPAGIDRVGEPQAAAPHAVLLLIRDSRVRFCLPGLQGFLGG